MEPILKIKNLTTCFKSEMGYIKAVNNVSFEVNKGEIIGIVGESGSGKSVTSLSIMGLLPKNNSKIESGEIIYRDKNLLQMKKKEMIKIRGNKISMIFQEPMTCLNPVFTIGDQLGEVFKNHTNLTKSEIKKKSISLLNRVEIPRADSIINEYPHQLSGGMAQRVMIAIAIALNPKILIADEPTTALDVTIQAQILDLLKKLSIEYDMAVIFITHNLGVVAEICNRAIVMYSGQFVEEANVVELFKNPKHPYTRSLLECIPKIGKNQKELKYIEGSVPHPGDEFFGCRFESRCIIKTDKCKKQEPPFFQITNSHRSKCWYIKE